MRFERDDLLEHLTQLDVLLLEPLDLCLECHSLCRQILCYQRVVMLYARYLVLDDELLKLYVSHVLCRFLLLIQVVFVLSWIHPARCIHFARGVGIKVENLRK